MVPQREDALTVFIEGLEFYAYHGVPAEERVIGHRYVVDLWMTVPSTACESDRVEDSVDYGQVALRLTEIGQSTQFLTVERLGKAMLDDIASSYPLVSSMRLRIAKRLPPAPVIAAATGIELRWER